MIGTLDSQVIQKFKEFQNKTDKYTDLDIEKVIFDKKTLDDIIDDFIKGSTPKYSTTLTDTIVIKSGQARGNYNKFDFSKIAYLDLTKVKNPKFLQKGDILINTTGVGTAGRVTLFELDGSYVSDSHITALRYDKDKINQFYLLYYFVNFGFKKLESMAEGSGGQIELNMNKVKPLSIPVPKDYSDNYKSFDIQKIIVEFLEYSFNYIDKIKHNIDKRYDIVKRMKKSLIPSTFKKTTIKDKFNKYAKENNIDFDITDIEFHSSPFNSFFENIAVTKKIKNKEFKSNGLYPVISQSEAFINGYYDDDSGIVQASKNPVIIFGDHTTILKYIDFDFLAGADGTKILRPLDSIYPKYAYFQSYNKIKSLGYQRHFQYFKEKKFLVPNLDGYSSIELQKIIADFIEHIDNELNEKYIKKFEKAYNVTERLKITYLVRTFSLINWGDMNG